MYLLGIQVGCFLNRSGQYCMPCWDTEGFFISFSLVRQVDMSSLFVRLSTEKCCTDVAVILFWLAGSWRDSNLYTRFQSGFLSCIWIFLRIRLVFQSLENLPPANDVLFFFHTLKVHAQASRLFSLFSFSLK